MLLSLALCKEDFGLEKVNHQKGSFWELRSNWYRGREASCSPPQGRGDYLSRGAAAWLGSVPHTRVIVLHNFPIGQDPNHPSRSYGFQLGCTFPQNSKHLKEKIYQS